MAGRRKNNQKVKPAGTVEQPELKFPAPADEKLDIPALETWLWDAACVIRGATDAPKFKDFILPLIFYKRLSDVFDDEFEKCAAKFGGGDIARAFIAEDHADALKTGRKPIVRFFVPHEYRWEAIRNYSRNLG